MNTLKEERKSFLFFYILNLKIMKIKILLGFLIITVLGCNQGQQKSDFLIKNQSDKIVVDKAREEQIINEHLKNGVWKHFYYSQEWQSEIDKGLAKDSTIAYLWQQKAMPMFKQGKYEIGMAYIDKAVEYDSAKWQEYRAFIKCVFAKTYKDAITDFEDCKIRFGDRYVMDHTYDYYLTKTT